MSRKLEEIKEEVAVMPQEQQDHLVAYLTRLRHLRDPVFREDLGQRIRVVLQSGGNEKT